MIAEITYKKIGDYLLLFNPKMASSFIGSATKSESKNLDFNLLNKLNTRQSKRQKSLFVKEIKESKKVIALIKEPHEKLISGLVTVIISGFKHYPRMVRKFEALEGYDFGYTHKVISKYVPHQQGIFMDEGFKFPIPLSNEDKLYIMKLIKFILIRGMQDISLMADGHLRAHHTMLSVFLNDLHLNHGVPKEKIQYIDLTSKDNMLYKLIYDNIGTRNRAKLIHNPTEEDKNETSNSWKKLMRELWAKLDIRENANILDERTSIEELFYYQIKSSYQELNENNYE